MGYLMNRVVDERREWKWLSILFRRLRYIYIYIIHGLRIILFVIYRTGKWLKLKENIENKQFHNFKNFVEYIYIYISGVIQY